MRESKLERYLDERARELGGRAIKTTSPAMDGWPDRVVILPACLPAFVEAKGDGGVLSERQQYWLAWLASRGQLVAVVRDEEGVRRLIEMMQCWHKPGGKG